MISLRSSWLDNYPACNRKAAAEWLLSALPDMAKAYGLLHTRPNIGAIVGSGTHAGVAYLLQTFKETGWHGGTKRMRRAQDHAAEDVKKRTEDPITTDDTTPTADRGIEATKRLVERYHLDVRHDDEPVLIEKGLAVEFQTDDGVTHKITSTVDNYLINACLEDTKTGVQRPKPFGQMGSYSMAIRANGYPLKGGKIRYGKRVRLSAPQPAIDTIPFDPMAFERHALDIAKHAAGGLVRLLKTGDPECLIANPRDSLCGAKWCPAWGSSFCTLGNALKGDEK